MSSKGDDESVRINDHRYKLPQVFGHRSSYEPQVVTKFIFHKIITQFRKANMEK